MKKLVWLSSLLISASHSTRFTLKKIYHVNYDGAQVNLFENSWEISALENDPRLAPIDIPVSVLTRRIQTFKDQTAQNDQSDAQLNAFKEIILPDPTNPNTVLAMARMTYNSYYEPNDKNWMKVPGWGVDNKFGWSSTGIRGYVFSEEQQDIQVIVIKGTSLATPIGSGPTATEDKFNDNMMFSCCCAKGGWEWTPICACPLTSNQCSMSCLLKESNFDRSYYNLAQTIYLAVKEWSPRANIWVTGHSLGGALASLIALTNDLPAFAYEAPGDLMYAARIGLLPEIPSPGNSKPNYTDFLSSLPIYHFGNSEDPIFLGTCRGIGSSCYWFDYALESQCHVGYECLYSPKDKVKNLKKKILKTSDTMHADMSSIKYHSIEYVIKNYLENAQAVPECRVKTDCMDKECSEWSWVD